MTVYTFETVGPAVEDYLERAIAAAASDGLVPGIGVEIADRVRVATGANRRTTTASLNEPDIVTLPRDRQWPPPTRADFARPVRNMTIEDTAYLAQGQPYSAARESIDGAVEAGIDAEQANWARDGKRAASKVKPR